MASHRRSGSDSAWSAALVIGAKLDKGEIAGLLDFAARHNRGRDAGTLHRLAEGIRRRGRRTLDVPAAREALAPLQSANPDGVRAAAAEVASLIRALSPAERSARIEQEKTAPLDDRRPIGERRRAIDALGRSTRARPSRSSACCSGRKSPNRCNGPRCGP